MRHSQIELACRISGDVNSLLNDSHVSFDKNNKPFPNLTTPTAFLGSGFRVEGKNGDPSHTFERL